VGYPTWQSSRERLGKYHPRHPSESELYRLVHHYHEELVVRWDELFFERYGVLRDEVPEAFERYLSCGVLRHGCARARCETCNHSILIAFSCKRRGVCPSCQAKRAVLFAEHLHENVLLAHPHRHLTFTIPKRIRIYFRYDRKLFGHFYRAAWETWSEYIQEVLPGTKTGAVMALHTWGSLLNWHPHSHAMVLNGGIDNDDTFIELAEVDTEILTERFAVKLLNSLHAEGLIDEDTIINIKSWEHSGFSVHAAEPIGADDEDARQFLARYLKKPAFSLTKLGVDDSGFEPVVILKSTNNNEEQLRTLSPLEFLAQLSLHVPRVFEQTTRFFGCYSCRTRGAKHRNEQFKKLLLNNFEVLEFEPPPRKPSAQWSRCMKRVFEVNPLECPRCGCEMKIVAFLLNPNEIDKLTSHLRYPKGKAPPPFLPLAGKLYIDSSPEFDQSLH